MPKLRPLTEVPRGIVYLSEVPEEAHCQLLTAVIPITLLAHFFPSPVQPSFLLQFWNQLWKKSLELMFLLQPLLVGKPIQDVESHAMTRTAVVMH